MSFTKEQILQVWRRGKPVVGYSPDLYRADTCGALMRFTDYGNRQSNFGWEIDHIKPLSKGGGDNISNLQPLQWENNVAKSDGKVPYCVVSFSPDK